ncbi:MULTISPECIES: leucine-rich repeat domain-containing protein [unclassified Legionella]|uniref:leucine-rich repeat domain-containing protein n=1 Tax=unclassified Legionella TaxID=2622702 RepID=UPI001E2A4486|nr:leucine-rich repeat domain-containing protein [Legionella sp. 31fI33]MCC5015109.1 leucine-rich repeat protein [Legionella sp. 31fI33]
MQLSRSGQTLISVSESDIVDGSCQIPAGVTAIGPYAFKNCTNLQTLMLPAGVTSIGSGAFWGCSKLQTLTLPAGITAIGDGAFFECVNLQTLTLPAGITDIDTATFCGCVNLQTLTIPVGITAIRLGAFFGCTHLQTLTLPVGVTSIAGEAFGECRSLQVITLPAGIIRIYDEAFHDCDSLTFIIIASDDETEVARITQLLPEELRSKVISKGLFDDVVRFQERQLGRLVSAPQTNRLYSFFNYDNQFMSKLVEKNEAGEAIKKACMKLPDDIFWHINKEVGAANPYYQQAQAAIKRESLPKTTQEFERYKERIEELVTQFIEKAMEQAERFSVPKTPGVANEEVTVCAPAV